jgi:exodeoxyribonuclease-5
VVRVKWSLKQASALDAIAAWLRDPNAKQTFYLAGLAGSGKSTLVEHVVGDLAGRVVYVAPTGKAALEMRRKNCPTAQTVHKAIYRPAGDPPSKESIEKLRAEVKRLYTIHGAGARATADKLAEQLARAEEDGKRKGPRFSLNLDSEVKGAALCVADECSMIDRPMGGDLESFGTKLLAIGDPAQLPPVYGAGYFTSREPDAFLDEIHRQALDSPILRLADLARRGQPLPYGNIGEGVEVLRYGDPSLEERALAAEMIIVGRNRTRHACNAKIRRLLGRGNEPAPVQGDHVVCRRNNHELGILNGSTWTIDRCVPNFDKMTAKIEVISSDDDADRVECEAWLHPFMAREDELEGLTRRANQEFQWAYALTCHSAQGSQFDDVLLFDESQQFARDASKWLYTGLTRAARTLTVVR